jgi:pyrroline-5-carboxylate reductase
MTYGVVGVGAIAAAIVTGLIECAPDDPQIVLSPRNARRAGFETASRGHVRRTRGTSAR